MASDPRLRSRLLIGAIAGFAGTLAMAAAMRRLRRRLPRSQGYPPPREIVDSPAADASLPLSDDDRLDAATAGHFLYGAATGSLIAAADPRIGPVTGALAGGGVWMASYLGWLPGMGILKPATRHPARRNALTLGAHLVWGAATALAMRELLAARETMLAAGEDKDAPPEGRKR